jgi:hypothetical protein
MTELTLSRRLAMAAFGIVLLGGVGWLAELTLSDSSRLALLFLVIAAMMIAFNATVKGVDSLSVSDATKGTLLILGPLAAIALVTSCADNRTTYSQAAEIAHDNASLVSYRDVAGTADCTSNCSGHEAGFEWARENGVTQAWDCPSSGNRSFLEGCDAFAGFVESEMDRQNWDDGGSIPTDY